MSTQPDNKSGLSRSTEAPGDAFLCVGEIKEYKVTDAWILTVLLKMRVRCEVVEEEKRQFQYSTNWTSDHLSLQVGWEFPSDLFCGGNIALCSIHPALAANVIAVERRKVVKAIVHSFLRHCQDN